MDALSLRRVEIRFARPRVENVEEVVRAEVTSAPGLLTNRKRIAVAVGSRGIANLNRVVRAVIQQLIALGAEPFIIPAMGSHGGATAEGQTQLLASYGITEPEIGCAIRSSMEVVQLEAPGLEHALFMDRHAHRADGIILINRVKLHTDYHGRYESGLAKMSVIGLGKERQALELHRFGVRGLRELMPKAAEAILATGKVIAGLAIVENAYDETMRIELVPAGEILKREPQLLQMARENMPRLPVDHLHMLIVDTLGKNISGAGMDTNVIGRIRIFGEPEPPAPVIQSIVACDVTDESHGNATGIGLADVVTRRLFRKIDWDVTYRNIITSSFLERGKLPVVAETAEEACRLAMRACGGVPATAARVIRIRDTLHLHALYASAAVCAELRGRPDVSILDEPIATFTESGDLTAF